jgi:hypothetical protein
MSVLKSLIYLLPVLGLVVFTTSCDEDDDCMAPAISENIVGSWEVSNSGDIVEFKADGTLDDPNDAIVGASGLPNKTYVATETELEVTASNDSGSNTFGTTFTVEDNQCDKITISFLGASVDLIRQ